MGAAAKGLIWCFTFVILESVQAVFFGGLFQRMDSFLIGSLIFGLSTIGGIAWTYFLDPGQLAAAFRHPAPLIGMNVTAALSWIAFLLAIQLIEPAVAFTIFSGCVPLTAVLAAKFGIAFAMPVRNAAEAWGNGLLAMGILALAAATLLGLSGFVRGGFGVGVFGVLVAVISGILSMAMLFCSYRLDRAGVSPMAQFGLRFPLYVVLTLGGFALGFDHKEDVPVGEIAAAVLIGLVVMAFPMYAVQRAVSLVPPLTIGAITALGPLIVFVLQLVEGRVDYAPATLVGLLIFFAGGVLAAFGSSRDRQGKAAPIARN